MSEFGKFWEEIFFAGFLGNLGSFSINLGRNGNKITLFGKFWEENNTLNLGNLGKFYGLQIQKFYAYNALFGKPIQNEK